MKPLQSRNVRKVFLRFPPDCFINGLMRNNNAHESYMRFVQYNLRVVQFSTERILRSYRSHPFFSLKPPVF